MPSRDWRDADMLKKRAQEGPYREPAKPTHDRPLSMCVITQELTCSSSDVFLGIRLKKAHKTFQGGYKVIASKLCDPNDTNGIQRVIKKYEELVPRLIQLDSNWDNQVQVSAFDKWGNKVND